MAQRRSGSGFVRENGLLLACLGLFGIFFLGMVVSGAATYNQEQQEHGSREQVSVVKYLTTGDFVEAVFENWESEFLQMGMYVVLTALLYQKGSSESKPLHKPEPQDEDPRDVTPSRWTPWPVRKGGWALRLYEHSLAIAFFALFSASFALHAAGGAKAFRRGTASTRRDRHLGVALPHDVAVLVRVDAELAKRVHCRRRNSRIVDFSAAAGLRRIETGGRAAPPHECLSAVTSMPARLLPEVFSQQPWP